MSLVAAWRPPRNRRGASPNFLRCRPRHPTAGFAVLVVDLVEHREACCRATPADRDLLARLLGVAPRTAAAWLRACVRAGLLRLGGGVLQLADAAAAGAPRWAVPWGLLRRRDLTPAQKLTWARVRAEQVARERRDAAWVDSCAARAADVGVAAATVRAAVRALERAGLVASRAVARRRGRGGLVRLLEVAANLGAALRRKPRQESTPPHGPSVCTSHAAGGTQVPESRTTGMTAGDLAQLAGAVVSRRRAVADAMPARVISPVPDQPEQATTSRSLMRVLSSANVHPGLYARRRSVLAVALLRAGVLRGEVLRWARAAAAAARNPGAYVAACARRRLHAAERRGTIPDVRRDPIRQLDRLLLDWGILPRDKARRRELALRLLPCAPTEPVLRAMLAEHREVRHSPDPCGAVLAALEDGSWRDLARDLGAATRPVVDQDRGAGATRAQRWIWSLLERGEDPAQIAKLADLTLDAARGACADAAIHVGGWSSLDEFLAAQRAALDERVKSMRAAMRRLRAPA